MEKEKKQRGSGILNYFIKTFNGMALGLFSTLIIGVIFEQTGKLLNWNDIESLGGMLKGLMGVGIGLGVTGSLNRKGLKLIAGAAAGGIGALMSKNDPMVSYLTTIIAVEVLQLILRRSTPLDILLIPLVSGLVAYFVALVIYPISSTIQESEISSIVQRLINHF